MPDASGFHIAQCPRGPSLTKPVSIYHELTCTFDGRPSSRPAVPPSIPLCRVARLRAPQLFAPHFGSTLRFQCYWQVLLPSHIGPHSKATVTRFSVLITSIHSRQSAELARPIVQMCERQSHKRKHLNCTNTVTAYGTLSKQEAITRSL